jgi:hypothetical protein
VRRAQKTEKPGAQQVALKMTLKEQIMEDKRRERQVNCRLNFVSFRSFIFTCCDFNLFLWLARYGYVFFSKEKEARKKLDNEEKEENDDQDEDGEGKDDLLDDEDEEMVEEEEEEESGNVIYCSRKIFTRNLHLL